KCLSEPVFCLCALAFFQQGSPLISFQLQPCSVVRLFPAQNFHYMRKWTQTIHIRSSSSSSSNKTRKFIHNLCKLLSSMQKSRSIYCPMRLRSRLTVLEMS